MFKKTGGSYSKKLEIADGTSFTFGETKLHFSDHVFHGAENSDLGWVLMTIIEHEDEKILFSSDIQGPIQVSILNKILTQQPQLVIVSEPPTYLAGI